MRKPFPLLLAALLALGLAPAQENQETTGEAEEAQRSMAQIIAEHPDLTTLYEILQGADLLATFETEEAEEGGAESAEGAEGSEGAEDAEGAEAGATEETGITLFAPSNAAFEALSQEQMDAIRADPEATLITHHVEEDAYTTDALEGNPISEEFTLVVQSDEAGNMTINGANLVEADLIASNGVIHIIDQVLALEAITSEGTGDEGTSGEGTSGEGTGGEGTGGEGTGGEGTGGEGTGGG